MFHKKMLVLHNSFSSQKVLNVDKHHVKMHSNFVIKFFLIYYLNKYLKYNYVHRRKEIINKGLLIKDYFIRKLKIVCENKML